MNTEINRKTIKEDIFELQDDGYREFHSSLVPGEDKIIGVRVPVLRKYAKELYSRYAGDTEELIGIIDDEYYEEIMLQGMLIGFQKKIGADSLFRQIDGFVPKIRNWGICDVFCAGLKQVKKYPEETYEFLQKYLDSSEEFNIRFGLVMLLDYYINEDYLHKILKKTEEIKHEGYYVKMAAAWLISICFVRFYDETLEFMKRCRLDDFTYNKALQKARESFRITPEQKDELKGMKKGR